MTRTTPELAPAYPTFTPHQRENIILCKSIIYLGAVFLVLLTVAKTETALSACEKKEKNQALLDLAKESIDKAKDLHPTCKNDKKGDSSNSSECGAKEKVSAYLEVAKTLIEEAKNKYPTCDGVKNVAEVAAAVRHKKPVDCAEVLENGQVKSDVYEIWPRNRVMGGESMQVYCDMETDGGGWTVIQRRTEAPNQTDFYRDWKAYKHGFGDIREEFWIGNDIIFALTNQRKYTLRFDMQNVSGDSRHAIYSHFWIEDEDAGYRMHIGDYKGTAGDGIRDADKTKFSTKDKRNDIADHVCTEEKKGGWWYRDCSRSNPNGVHAPGGEDDKSYVNWYPWTQYDALLAIEMKIR
ncbi:Techylectin-5A [Araneus ventricosus]|uniref:Techylectin-5A n=1 Tax=Araneus ventricosus TaxID=182803 RepID=A0A4Y2ESA9_ARAVE|nr:Techylectin-5A [Araneus ventricosus]